MKFTSQTCLLVCGVAVVAAGSTLASPATSDVQPAVRVVVTSSSDSSNVKSAAQASAGRVLSPAATSSKAGNENDGVSSSSNDNTDDTDANDEDDNDNTKTSATSNSSSSSDDDDTTAATTSSSTSSKNTAASSSSASTSTSTTAATVVTVNSVAISPLGSASDVFVEGAACRASWIPTTNTDWKSMTIDLMTGSNLAMTKLATVTSGVDGTDTSVTSFNYSCPNVSPNSAIYFLQYTHDNGKDPLWTTRFAIADGKGQTTAPPEANQPSGGSPAIPWGNGQLVVASTTATSTASSAKSTKTSSVIKSSEANSLLKSQQDGAWHLPHLTIITLALPAVAAYWLL